MPESIDTSLVRIHTKAGGVAGAGFLVGTRHILTCAHVIAKALGLADDAPDPPSSTVSLDFPQLASHTLITAKVVFYLSVQGDGRGDIAGLELLDEPPVHAEAVQFAPADQVWDHPFRALGFPQGYDEGVWATGRLLGRQGTNWIQIEDVKIPGIAVIAGFSGAPVWDTQLEGIVGMVVAASQQATAKMAFVIPTDVLVAAWPQLATLMRPPVPRNPFKGLNAFTENDSRDFFGRDKLIGALATAVETTLIREQNEGQHARLLAVLGASGSGKSSVVKAGLLPCLRDGRVLNSKEWVYLDPVSAPSQRKVVLLVDQFEEVFTLTTDEAERRHFFELLVTAVTVPSGPLFVILTLRADFYDRPMQYPELFRLIDDHHVSVLPLERDELRRVIEQPANLPDVQVIFESGLVDELLFDMQGQSGALPLLEFTLDQLFQRRSGHQLTLQAYREMSGIKGALSQHAEETYQKLTPEQQKAARDIFLRLIEPGTTEQDATRHRATRSEFESADPIEEQRMRETLEAFYKARLLTTNQSGSTTTVEVSHEALIREWTTLSEWLRKASNDIHFQRSLSEDVKEWEQRKRPRVRLYRGAQLKEAQAWARRNRPSEHEVAFLRASAAQRTLWLAGIIVVVLLLVSSLGIAGWFVFFQPSKTLVTTLQDNGVGSLRWCIDNAPSGSTIKFAQGMSGTIKLRESLEFLSGEQLTIQGPGADQITISGGNKTFAHIHVPPGATVKISDLSFKNSETTIDPFLFNEGTLTVTKSVISGNKTHAHVTSYGGGIGNVGTLTVNNSTISNNSSSSDVQNGQGGGIYNEGKLTVTASAISNNKAIGSKSVGGGIYNAEIGTLMVADSTFSDNSASTSGSSGLGGGIANDGKLTVTSSTFSNNLASSSGSSNSYGGGIYNSGIGTLTVTDSKFSNNWANSNGSSNSYGGGIDNDGKLTVISSAFSGNLASGEQEAVGGGIANDGKLTVTDSTFSDNSASSNASNGFGGGIDNFSTGILMMSNSTFSGNSASGKQEVAGGGIDNESRLTVTDSTFSDNSASSSASNGFGGGIDNSSTGTLIVTDSTFSNNSASGEQSGEGGGIDNEGKLTVTTSSFSINSADYGGSIDNFGKLIVAISTFVNNEASGEGGGILSSSTKGASAIIDFCTFYGNTSSAGGAIWVDPTGSSHLTISGSVIAANSAHVGPDISGALISGGYNLIKNVAGATGLNTTTDKQVTLTELGISPTLGNNGGPTQTLALLQGSIAIDAVPLQECSITITDISGHNVTITTDQRGDPRPDGSENACDIGAYESSY